MVKQNIIYFRQHCGVDLGREGAEQEIDGVTDKLAIFCPLGNHHRNPLVVPELCGNVKITVEHIRHRLRSVEYGNNIDYRVHLVCIRKLLAECGEYRSAETDGQEVDLLCACFLKHHIYVAVKPLRRRHRIAEKRE